MQILGIIWGIGSYAKLNTNPPETNVKLVIKYLEI